MAQIVAGPVHAVPDQLDVQRVLTEHELPHEFLDQADLGFEVAEVIGVGAAGDALADPGEALVGLEFEEEEVPAADVGRLGLDDHRPESRDLHHLSPMWFASPGSPDRI